MKKIKVCAISDLPPGSMKGIEYDAGRVLVANVGGRLYAMDGTCSHEEADLSTGFLLEGRVTCPLHLSQFDVRTGEVLGLPATVSLRQFRIIVEDGEVFVEVG